MVSNIKLCTVPMYICTLSLNMCTCARAHTRCDGTHLNCTFQFQRIFSHPSTAHEQLKFCLSLLDELCKHAIFQVRSRCDQPHHSLINEDEKKNYKFSVHLHIDLCFFIFSIQKYSLNEPSVTLWKEHLLMQVQNICIYIFYT